MAIRIVWEWDLVTVHRGVDTLGDALATIGNYDDGIDDVPFGGVYSWKRVDEDYQEPDDNVELVVMDVVAPSDDDVPF